MTEKDLEILNKIEQVRIGKIPISRAFLALFNHTKSEKFRFSRGDFSLFLCCYCLIYILINKAQQQQNRTNFNSYFNSGDKSEKIRSVLQAENTKAPAARRHPGAIAKDARSLELLEHLIYPVSGASQRFAGAKRGDTRNRAASSRRCEGCQARRQPAQTRASARACLVAPSTPSQLPAGAGSGDTRNASASSRQRAGCQASDYLGNLDDIPATIRLSADLIKQAKGVITYGPNSWN